MGKKSFAARMSCMLALMLCVARPARADVLSQLPADTAIVLKFNHVADTNQKLSALLTQLGITDLVPAMKDPLQFLFDSGEFPAGNAGIDTKGDAAIFFTADGISKHPDGVQDGPPAAMLIPVTDYKAFLGAFTVVRTEGETTVAHFKDKPGDIFLQQWGGYAVLAGDKEFVSVKHEGLKVTGTAGKELTNDDVVFFTNFATLKTVLLPKLAEGEKFLIEEAGNQTPDEGHKKAATAAIKQAMQLVREFLNDAEGSAAGLTLGDKGISTSLTVDFRPDTYLGKLFSTMKQTDGSLLGGLPKEKYIAFGGYVTDPAWTAKLFDDLVNPIAAELPGMGDDGKKAMDAIAAFRAGAGSFESGAVGLLVPTGPMKQTSLIQEIFVIKGDAAKMKDMQSKMMDTMTTVMAAFMKLAAAQVGGGQGINDDLFKVVSTPAFKTIADVSFDRIQIQVDPNNNGAMAMQMNESFKMMYGPDGLTILSGIADSKTYIGAIGVPEAILSETVESSKSGLDVMSETMKKIDANLPKKRAMVEYFGLGQYLSTVMDYAKAMGAPINIALPANLPPIGMTVSAEGSSLRVDGYIPESLIQNLVQVGMQFYMQMNGRRGNGGGGL